MVSVNLRSDQVSFFFFFLEPPNNFLNIKHFHETRQLITGFMSKCFYRIIYGLDVSYWSLCTCPFILMHGSVKNKGLHTSGSQPGSRVGTEMACPDPPCHGPLQGPFWQQGPSGWPQADE